MEERDERRETGQWLLGTVALWLVLALGLASGVAGVVLFGHVNAIEERVIEQTDALESLRARVDALERGR